MFNAMPTAVRHCKQFLKPMAFCAVLVLWASPGWSAGPLYWDMPEGMPFTNCRLEGARITGNGFLAPGLPSKSHVDVDQDIVWCQVPDGRGGFYLGTGHQGQIMALDSEGNLEVWADLDCEEVLCLDVLPDGKVVAGCEPDGQVFLIDQHQEINALGKKEGGYIWSITHDSHGQIYLATGNPAGLVKVDPEQSSWVEMTPLPAENALDLALEPSGDLLVSTQGPGMVYRVDPAHPDTPTLLLQTPQNEINTLVVGPDGGFFALAVESNQQDSADAGSAGNPKAPKNPPHMVVMNPGSRAKGKDIPRAALYEIDNPTAPEAIWSGGLDVMSVAYVRDLGWVAGGLQSKDNDLTVLYRLLPPDNVEMLTSWQGGDIVSLLVPDATNDLHVVQAHPSRIDVFDPGTKGSMMATGPILDAGHMVRWGRLFWEGPQAGGKLKWSVRTGNRDFADASWSEWSKPWAERDHGIQAPSSRFLQWRVVFAPAEISDLPRVTHVTVSAWGTNRAPVISAFRQEKLSGVRKGGLMARSPHLTRKFASGLKAEFNRDESPERPQPSDRVRLGNAVVVFSWEATDPDSDRLQYELACRKKGSSRWQTVASGAGSNLEAWDTGGVPDGLYDVKIKVNDNLDNAADQGLSSERVLGPVLVDNTPPEIQKLSATYSAGVLKLHFDVEDAGSPVAAAYLVLDTGARERLDPEDQVCDSRLESFATQHRCVNSEEAPGWAQIEVLDVRGNLAVGKCRVEGD